MQDCEYQIQLFVKEIDNTIEDFKHNEIKGTYFMQKESWTKLLLIRL